MKNSSVLQKIAICAFLAMLFTVVIASPGQSEERLFWLFDVTVTDDDYEWELLAELAEHPDFDAFYYMNASDVVRELVWETMTIEEKIDLSRKIGRVEGNYGMESWRELDTDYMAYVASGTDLSKVDFSDWAPLVEWVRDTYEQKHEAISQIVDQVIQGPNPDLPGVWGWRRPYGDIYGPNDRILDDLGNEYIKGADGTWSATGENFGPFRPDLPLPGTETAAADQPQPGGDTPAAASLPQPGGDIPAAASQPQPGGGTAATASQPQPGGDTAATSSQSPSGDDQPLYIPGQADGIFGAPPQ